MPCPSQSYSFSLGFHSSTPTSPRSSLLAYSAASPDLAPWYPNTILANRSTLKVLGLGGSPPIPQRNAIPRQNNVIYSRHDPPFGLQRRLWVLFEAMLFIGRGAP